MEEDVLMRLAAEGDHQAFGQIVKRYHVPLIRFTARMLSDAEAAQDAAQETFLRVWRARARYQSQGQFRLYLFRVARNVCLDYLRCQPDSERLFHLAEDENEIAVARQRDLFSAVESQMLREAVNAVLASLPEPHRAVFVFSEYEGMTYKEIALVMECPLGTVASRKFQVMETLRRRLRGWMDAPEAGGGTGSDTGGRAEKRYDKQEQNNQEQNRDKIKQ